MRTVASLLGVLLLASGCELIADFDRTKIPGMNVDSGRPPDEDDAGGGDAAVSGDAAAGDDAGGE